MWQQNTIGLSEIKTKITPFERELLGLFPNVKFVPKYWEMKENTNELCAYMPRKDAIYLTHDLPRVSHEISHIIEMTDFDRLIKDDLGLGWDHPLDEWFKNKNSSIRIKAAARECRVKAIESFFCKSQYTNNRVLNNNWYERILYPLVKNESFGRFKSTKDIDEWLQTIFATTQKKWSIDRIQYEWKRRVDYIRDWQEAS